ncbi:MULTISPECIES: ABC transporter permease [Paraclostridium]|jgi:spermidine/putrescine transport system permease protein|nr:MULTISPECIES: ABC transporter permease [Paraclostridium]RDC49996.1 ABC transporter permease [Acinetobacter sp. RIT592]EQK44556.1 binding--dependent transport system inner membrane component family protein [[Clostridium] bifermentans ATCC 638] [Paraclostridium bifermentans ATCC 638 = DSM 14991]MBS5954811.1 ABC transporter permease [Paraclostridium bifermentans]MBS6509667.1 ABC transporter permease [Paraclostridium bifermentans]MBU5289964.1 ABC transporter permease [Paraclostridium bifermenta
MKKNKSILAYPYIIWSALFIVVPLILVLVFSFTVENGDKLIFSLENYKRLINPIYLKVFLRSIVLAGSSTIICLLVGYPVAYIISKAHISKRNTLILLFILPMWMNFLLRTYAWVAILGKNGILNSFLGLFGIEPVTLLYTNFAILLGMVYNFLPFMVLPIYTSLSKMDNDLINAARDLGANSFQVFTKVIFPLSVPGVISGITMVFMPAVTTFAISRLLGGGKFMLLGDLIEQQFTVVGDWNFGSAISIFMMIVILISMAVMSRFEDDSDKEGGGLLF